MFEDRITEIANRHGYELFVYEYTNRWQGHPILVIVLVEEEEEEEGQRQGDMMTTSESQYQPNIVTHITRFADIPTESTNNYKKIICK